MANDETLKVKMLKTQKGSLDGVSCVIYPEGEVVTFTGARAVDLGRVFVRHGWASEVNEEMPAIAVEVKQGPKPQNKQARKPPGKRRGR